MLTVDKKMSVKTKSKLVPPHNYKKLNTVVTPGCLKFYVDALKFSAKCRSFIVYTYPIGFKILGENENYLFSQTQYFLEYALEVLDKYFENNPLKSLIDKNETGVCLSKEYSNIKAHIQRLTVNLGEQFKNAKKEFSNREFLKKIQEKFNKDKESILNSKRTE